MIHKIEVPLASIRWEPPDEGPGIYRWAVHTGNVRVAGNAFSLRKARRQIRRALRSARWMGGKP